MKIMSALIATQKNLEGGEFNIKYRYQPHLVILAQKLVAKKNRVKNAKAHKF